VSKYTEISITDGVTTKKKLFTDIATDELSVNEIVNLLHFESKKPIWAYFIHFTQIEAHMNTMSYNKSGLSGTVTVNGNCLNIEPFDEGDAFGLITRLKDEAVKQYLAGARS
tara:strand:+ start:716 stop:1051 length:336 start_codon:yes stop_codon:yes gene_type:complete